MGRFSLFVVQIQQVLCQHTATISWSIFRQDYQNLSWLGKSKSLLKQTLITLKIAFDFWGKGKHSEKDLHKKLSLAETLHERMLFASSLRWIQIVCNEPRTFPGALYCGWFSSMLCFVAPVVPSTWTLTWSCHEPRIFSGADDSALCRALERQLTLGPSCYWKGRIWRG